MERLKCIISYDGSAFSGYQLQPNKRTVQLEIENTLSKLHKGNIIKVVASGRTDATVHAVGQVIHFDTSLTIPVDRWKKALNSLLPKDIAVVHIEKVNEAFHARFDVQSKEYRYKLLTSADQDVFKRHYSYHFPYPLDLDLIDEAIIYLLGEHDFTSFCSAKTEVKDKVRTIFEIDYYKEEDELIFRFVGNGFLYNMVRIIVGTLLEVGQKKTMPVEIKNILAQKNRGFAGKTAPGHGLYLWKVHYDN
ncbi:tRNA pseudouridine(38-40) synthase TruA [Cytobacillus sp. S13-E01]|uniref:tRNA pseudouridine(38-40) synthase TruA n=1 Tax=Cytobacillus sp. S13-E01 TaxID=3031326 RepID=UPI0023D828A8|nr:tRNA pseudouridine(38-40) synthase TruA [Cytobacillus sp. S13-E01]MDF0727545.1 tRNA pseudouridine(38-40) synthase TruA [Cytobacillus sp. S13-E01]